MLPILNKRKIHVDDFFLEEASLAKGVIGWKSYDIPNGFDFLSKLDLPTSWLQKNTAKKIKIIPDLIANALEDDTVKNMVILTSDDAPLKIVKDREILQYSTIIEEMKTSGVKAGLGEPKFTVYNDGEMVARAFSETENRISPREGDVLRLGTKFNYFPAERLAATSLVERLICLNGMSKIDEKFRWNADELENQIEFIRSRLFTSMINGSQLVTAAHLLQMRTIPDGISVSQFIRELAASWGITDAEHVKAIVESFNADGDVDLNRQTHWDVMNAFTHAITHKFPDSERDRHSDLIGELMYRVATQGLLLVDARVPRIIAQIWGEIK